VDADAKVRELALYYFSRIGAPATPEVEAADDMAALLDAAGESMRHAGD